MKRYRLAIIAALALLLAFGVAFAQMGMGPGGGRGRGRGMGRGWGMGPGGAGAGFDLAAALALTEEQETKLDALEEKLVADRTAHITTMQKLRLELLGLLQGGAAEKALDAKIKEMAAERDKMQKIVSDYWLSVWNLLTKEQKQKYLTLGGGPCAGLGPGGGWGMGAGGWW